MENFIKEIIFEVDFEKIVLLWLLEMVERVVKDICVRWNKMS